MHRSNIALLALVAGLAASAHAATINVPADFPTIQAAINAAVDNDEILVAPGTYPELVDFLGKTIILRSTGGAAVTTIDGTGFADSTVTIIGSGAGTLLEGFTVIAGGGKPDAVDPFLTQGGALFVDTAPVQIVASVFTGGSVSDDGGAAIIIDSDATIDNCRFENSVADDDLNTNGDGGGLAINGILLTPTVTIRNSTFSNNFTSDDGGGLSIIGADAIIDGCNFVANRADDNGGGIFYLGAGGTLSNSEFFNNSADEGGGVHLNTNGTPTMTGLNFTNNEATGPGPNGGGLYILAATASISDSTFTGNTSEGTGGAINVGSATSGTPGVLTVDNCIFTNNSATGSGDAGAIDISGSVANLTLLNSTFVGNSATDDGGDLRFINGAVGLVDNCTFSDSSALDAGGSIYNFSSPDLTIRNSAFSNSDGGRGGAFTALLSTSATAFPSSTTLQDVTIVGGSSFDFGGGMFLGAGTTTTGTNVRISSSTAGLTGPAMQVAGATATFNNLIIDNNTSTAGFGASAIELAGGTAFAASLTLINATIVDNTNPGAQAAILSLNPTDSVTIANSIIRDNDGLEQIDVPNTTVTYSNVQGGIGGTGNIDADPQFNNAAGADYSLASTSPSIDAGDNTAVTVSVDFAGDSRFSDVASVPDTGNGSAPIVDMGAFEVQGGTGGCNAADISSPANPGVPDGLLSGADFFEFLNRFAAGDLSIDFSSPANPGVPDGLLSGADFFEFLTLFGQGC